jgi:class 3 adenylate cyclase/ketosteroid isomerase-like protein
VEPSPELEAVVRRRFAAWNAGDFEAIINLCADEPGVLFIGSDPDEWWSGFETFRRIVESQIGERADLGVSIDLEEVVAFSDGMLGWAACRLTLRRADGTTVALRNTGILHLNHGVWRFVHTHLSQGVANEEVFGTTLTTTVEHLAAAVRVEQPDLTGTMADDGTVTIAFSDIERSTDLAVRLGDKKWFELLRWHNHLVSKCVADYGGRIVKSLGDGYMFAFASASRALNSSIDIQRSLNDAHDGENLSVRIGLHTGEVLRDADDFFGHAVIIAARIAAAAEGNEVLVSSLVNELTRGVGTFKFGEPRSVQLEGFPGERQVFPLIWRAEEHSLG